MACAIPTGMATMMAATITLQKTIRDRATAAWTVTGRPDRCPPRIDAAIAWLSTAATIRPIAATTPSAAATPPRAPSSRRAISLRVWWIDTTSSAKLATASGPTVPRVTRPM